MIYVNRLLWLITTSVIILLSFYFSFKLKFPQLHLKKIFKSIHTKSQNDVTVLDSLMMSLSSRIGVGSVAGIALAIKYGGMGSIFWIWLITIIISSISYLESYYGNKFKTKTSDGTYIGGPHHYLKKILNRPKLAITYALLIVIAYGIGFITIQTNTVSIVSKISVPIDGNIINVVILLTAIYFLCSNTKKKNGIISKIVPIMTILYLLLGSVIILQDVNRTVVIFKEIFHQAFRPKAIGGGILSSFVIGMQRAIFSTEVSIGTSAIASAMTEANSQNQGSVEILGNYITTFIICTITAFIILSSNYNNYVDVATNGIEMAYFAFEYHFGSIGKLFIWFFIILFAYSTIISGFYYGESALSFITERLSIKKMYKVVVIVFIFISTHINGTMIWSFIDILVAILSLINLYAITKIYQKEHN